MPKSVGAVVEDKQNLLLKEFLGQINYDDQEVADLLVSGVKVVGKQKSTGIWKPKFRPATCTVDALWECAKVSQEKLASKEEVTREAFPPWQGALEYVKLGRMDGPFTTEEASQIVGPLWTVARRFPPVQGDKVRPVDDFRNLR